MHYVIRISAASMELPPLFAVADAMARSAATAGGTSFHEPMYRGRLKALLRRIIADAEESRLSVRDWSGRLGTVGEIVQRSKGEGNYAEVRDNPCGQTDLDKTLGLLLHSSIPELNEWGASSGDSFAIDSTNVAWVDERGLVSPCPTEQAKVERQHAIPRPASPAIVGPAGGNGDTPHDSESPWQERARAIADELDAAAAKCEAYDSVRHMAERVASEMRKRGINGLRGPVSGGTVLREALQGGRWNRKR